MRARYSESFQKQAVEKFLNRGEKSAEDIAKELGVSTFSLYGWTKTMSRTGNMKKSSLMDADKFDAIISFLGLRDDKQGEFLRTRGFTTSQIASWKAEIKAKLDAKSNVSRGEVSLAKARIKELEREVRRKDKALAETTALLVLSKKLEALWEKGSDEVL